MLPPRTRDLVPGSLPYSSCGTGTGTRNPRHRQVATVSAGKRWSTSLRDGSQMPLRLMPLCAAGPCIRAGEKTPGVRGQSPRRSVRRITVKAAMPVRDELTGAVRAGTPGPCSRWWRGRPASSRRGRGRWDGQRVCGRTLEVRRLSGQGSHSDDAGWGFERLHHGADARRRSPPVLFGVRGKPARRGYFIPELQTHARCGQGGQRLPRFNHPFERFPHRQCGPSDAGHRGETGPGLDERLCPEDRSDVSAAHRQRRPGPDGGRG